MAVVLLPTLPLPMLATLLGGMLTGGATPMGGP